MSGIPWIVVLGKDALPSDRTLWKKEKEVELLHHLMEVEGKGTVEIQERGTGIKVNVKYGEVLSYFKKHSRCRTASEMLQNGFDEQSAAPVFRICVLHDSIRGSFPLFRTSGSLATVFACVFVRGFFIVTRLKVGVVTPSIKL